MHKPADRITEAIDIPFVHIADATADAVREAAMGTVGLLGAAYTMEQEFYRGRLERLHGLTVLVPGEQDRRVAHDVIYGELCLGIAREESREAYRRIMRWPAERGAEAILFGCTEIGLLVGGDDSLVPVFDTTRLHAAKAVALALT